MLRLLHTSDWHLGHTLHDQPRTREHERFLGWLLDVLRDEAVDALVVTGDVFDTANPSAAAQRAWFRFLGAARRRCPDLDVVVIAGNHDSGARLDAPAPVLDAFAVHVVGALPRGADGALDPERLVHPLTDRDGAVAAWIAAVPFLRPADLPRPASAGPDDGGGADGGGADGGGADGDGREDGGGDPLVEGVRRVYAEAIDLARARREAGQALVVTGHCYLTGTTLSELSERKILGGNQHALPVDLFPDDVTYAALGHLHLAQTVGGRAEVRYAGSPIPLALDEDRYPHQVCVVELDGPALAAVRPVRVPRSVDILRLPEDGPGPLDEVLDALRALPERDDAVPDDERPFLEVRVRLERRQPIKRAVEDALEGRHPRLLRLSTSYGGSGAALADGASARTLGEVTPDEVFRRRWARDNEGEPPPALLAAYHELLEAVAREEAP